MKIYKSRALAPSTLVFGSLLSLGALVFLTSPVTNVSYAILFFGLLLILLTGLGNLWITLVVGKVSGRARTRILIISFLVVIIAMLSSLGSLGLVDLLVASLLAAGLLFYSSRR